MFIIILKVFKKSITSPKCIHRIFLPNFINLDSLLIIFHGPQISDVSGFCRDTKLQPILVKKEEKLDNFHSIFSVGFVKVSL